MTEMNSWHGDKIWSVKGKISDIACIQDQLMIDISLFLCSEEPGKVVGAFSTSKPQGLLYI